MTEFVRTYLRRIARYVTLEEREQRTESALLDVADRHPGRVPALLILLDSRGRQFSSEGLAEWIRAERDGGRQRLIFAIGPADGWSEAARSRAGMLLSLGLSRYRMNWLAWCW